MKKISFVFSGDKMWARVLGLVTVMFFVYLSDAILSDWVPGFLQDSLGDSLKMGLVFSFSSVIGLLADLIFPQLLKQLSVKKLLLLGIGSSAMFLVSLFWATFQPFLIILLFAMGVWGIYYELFGFANQQFVADVVPNNERSRVWGLVATIKGLAYFLGPLIGAFLLVRGDRVVLLFSAFFTFFSYLLFLFYKTSGRENEVKLEEVNLVSEISHWKVLFVHVWPLILISLFLGLIDSIYWTTGAVLSDHLAEHAWYGSWFLSMYMLPSLFVGFLVMKWGIRERKKRWAEVFMLIGCLLLVLVGLMENVVLILGAVFLSSVMLSVTYPLVDAVYSDIVFRMGRERKHLIGLSSSVLSLAYIVGPILGGGMARIVGEQKTFMLLGLVASLGTVVMLFVTPKKLRLPQQEIAGWN